MNPEGTGASLYRMICNLYHTCYNVVSTDAGYLSLTADVQILTTHPEVAPSREPFTGFYSTYA
jgi:hypothetical protein